MGYTNFNFQCLKTFEEKNYKRTVLLTCHVPIFCTSNYCGISQHANIDVLFFLSLRPCHILLYKKLRYYVRSDWLRWVFAWGYVNLVVTSRCFAFRVLIRQPRIWKSFWVENLTSYFIYSFLCQLKLGKTLQTSCVIFFFCLSWHFKRENSVFWKASFCKTKTDHVRKTLCTILCDW